MYVRIDSYTTLEVNIMKRIFCLIVCILIAVSAVSVCMVSGAETLTLDENAVFIDGYPDKTFLPDKTMTRAEAIKVVSVAAGYTTAFDASSVKTAFTDMADTEWYAPNVKYLEKYDVLDFYGTKLDAGKGITRGEFVKLIATFVPEKTSTKSFPDVPTSHPYYNEIIKAAKAGIVEGNPDGTFAPDATLTRAEIVTIIDRLLGRNIVETNTRKVAKFSDIADHWAQEEVIAASCTATYNGIILWYTGNAYSANSPVDKTKLDYSTTQAILNGIDATDADAVNKSIEAHREKRIAEIRATPNTFKEGAGKTNYYVSSSTGNDANDGLTPETAWKTIDKVNSMAIKGGSVVYFKRSDTFRGKIATRYNVTYTAYGEGAKPVINGSLRNYAEDKAFWQKTDKKNVWVSSDTFDEDIGNIVFNDGEAWAYRKVPGINGSLLIKDLEIFYDTSDKKIYLYSKTDPNTRFTSTEICTYTPMISGNGTKVTIDNLCIKYGGGYAISFTDGTANLTVSNCEIGWCGGTLWKSSEDPIRLGNGAEIHGNSKDFTVENCYIYQIFDSGVSHQYFGTNYPGRMDMINIKYLDNVIESCAMGGLEYVNSSAANKGIMKNIEVSGNLFVRTGDSWGLQRAQRYGHMQVAIMGRPDVNNAENFLIYDNVISVTHKEAQHIQIGAEDAAYMPEITGNLFYGIKGHEFGVYGASADINRYNAMLTYDETITDKTIGLEDNIFVFQD